MISTSSSFKEASREHDSKSTIEDVQDLEFNQPMGLDEATEAELPLEARQYGANYRLPVISPEEAKRIKAQR